MTPSGPYQSRLLNLLVRQTRRLRDKSRQTLRQLRTTAIWGTQILLYPIYVLFQSGRVLERQVKQAVRRSLPKLKAIQRPLKRFTRPSRTPLPPRVDTPIRNTLQTLQSLRLPVSIDPHGAIAPSPPTLSPLPNPQLPNPNPQLPNPNPIRAIATHLSTRSLVLVTANNDILDILTPEQQRYVQQRLIGELADYLRYQKQQLAEQGQPLPFLPPPVRRPTQLLPVRAFRRVMDWMQRGPVAMTANLFQELTLAHYLLEQDGAIAPPPYSSVPIRFSRQSVPSLPLASSTKPPRQNGQLGRSPLKALKSALPNPWPNLFGKSRPVPMGDREVAQAIVPVAQPETSVMRNDDGGGLVSTSAASLGGVLQSPSEAVLSVAEQPHSLTPDRNAATHNPPSLNAEPHPATIDTQVTLVEYVKHPLEQLLEWIDRGMLWLEKRIARLLTWLRQR